MNRLKWWMRSVGLFYLLLGVGFVPFVNEARLPLLVPGFTAPPRSVEYMALIDWTFVFGLDLLVTGGLLLYAARQPLRNVMLAWLVIWLEIVRGVFADLYYISRGFESVPFYVVFIAVHLVVIVTGVMFVRQAQAAARAAAATAPSTVTAAS